MDTDQPSDLRRRFRFNLRTLFILFTAISIWLGMRVHQARVQEAAVAVIERAGATVRYDYQYDRSGKLKQKAEPWAPLWLRKAFGEHFFIRPYGVYLYGMDGVANRTAKPPIMFSVERRHVAPALIDAINQLRCLRELELITTDLTDVGIAQLAWRTQIRRLRLDGNAITDACLVDLSRMTSLEHLDLRNTQFSAAAIASLREQLPRTKCYYKTDIEIPDAYWTTQHGRFQDP